MKKLFKSSVGVLPVFIAGLILAPSLVQAQTDSAIGLGRMCVAQSIWNLGRVIFILISFLIVVIWLLIQNLKADKQGPGSRLRKILLVTLPLSSGLFFFIVDYSIISLFCRYTFRGMCIIFNDDSLIGLTVLVAIFLPLIVYGLRFIVLMARGRINRKKLKVLGVIIGILAVIYFIFYSAYGSGTFFTDKISNSQWCSGSSDYGHGNISFKESPFAATDLSSYCVDRLDDNLKVRALGLPTKYINEHELKPYLEVWKEIFMEYNRLTAHYFDDHIRIKEVTLADIPLCNEEFYADRCAAGLNKYLEIQYYVVFDWAQIQKRDGISLKIGTDNDSTTEELLSRLRQAIDKKEQFYASGGFSAGTTNADISDAWGWRISAIRNRQKATDQKTFNYGSLVEDIISCEQALAIISASAKNYEVSVGNVFSLRADGPVLSAGYFTGGNSCPTINVLLDGGANYVMSNPCAVE